MVDIWTIGQVRYTTNLTLEVVKCLLEEHVETEWMLVSLIDGHYAYIRPKDILCFNSTSEAETENFY